MLAGPRLRQVALAAADCGATASQLKMTVGWPGPFRDPGVSRFGLTNAVLAAGDTFAGVVAPGRPGTTAGRVLGLTVSEEGGTVTIELEHARQDLRFVPVAPGRGEGITEVRLTTERPVPAVQIGGVRFVSTAPVAGGQSP